MIIAGLMILAVVAFAFFDDIQPYIRKRKKRTSMSYRKGGSIKSLRKRK